MSDAMNPNPGPANSTEAAPAITADAAMAELHARFTQGVHWFYWLAGLSLVNSIIAYFQGNTRFIFGLGITQVVDAVGQNMGANAMKLLFIDVLIAGAFVAFGYLAAQKQKAIFVVGMILYALDLALCLVLQDWISSAVHGYVLWRLWGGFTACSEYLKLEQMVAPGLSVVNTK